MNSKISLFQKAGGEFIVSPFVLEQKALTVSAFLFDWDGVFNDGIKGDGKSSHFSEADSMGLNILRFSYWLKHGKLPFTAIVTGEHNESAFHLAKRECFNAVYFKTIHKMMALTHIEETQKIKSDAVAFMFDDILDLGLASKVGLRILINRHSSPLFREYVRTEKLADYITFSEGGTHGVREATELVNGLLGNLEQAIKSRVAFDEKYQRYLEEKRATKPKFYTSSGHSIVESIL